MKQLEFALYNETTCYGCGKPMERKSYVMLQFCDRCEKLIRKNK